MQMELMYSVIRGNSHVILHLQDSGTAFSEASIVPSRHLDVIKETFETEPINRNEGAGVGVRG